MYFFSKIYMDFQKERAKWQHSMANCQRLTSRLTTTFAKITQPVATQNTFVISFLDNFNQWNKLDTKNQKSKHTKMNFSTVNRKIRKKGYEDIHLFHQETVNRCFSNKI